MFDIGFWELAVIGVIALLVVGPERLPSVARNVGLWVGRIRRYVSHVKRDIERELHAEEVRALIEDPEGIDGLRDVARETASVLEETRKELSSVQREAESASAPEQTPPAPEEAASARPIPHHAVDEDPFAARSASQAVTDDGDAVPGEAPSGNDAEQPVPDHEQRPERPGQP